MITNCTAVSVVWKEGHRIEALLDLLAAHFQNIVVVVQESPDETLDIARRVLTGPDHKVVEDEWRGGGDFSMPLALSHVETPWTFVISGDETMDAALLRSIPDAIRQMEKGGYSGTMIRCEEWIEGVKYVEHPAHVRLFRTEGGWEARHHSAASHENLMPGIWPLGQYIHTRTLAEVFEDYLRKLRMMESEGLTNLADHNRYTLFTVANLVAGAKGWKFVRSLPLWDEVEAQVFNRVDTGLVVV